MQTDYLKYLLDVSELGSIAAAAEKSFITPQGVRRAIGVLESEIGYPLLVREGRSAHLTEYGQAILKDARDILAAQNRMQRKIAEVSQASERATSYTIDAYFHSAVFDTSFFSPLLSSPKNIVRTIRFSSSSNADVAKHLADSSDKLDDTVKIGVLALFSQYPEENADLISELAKNGFMVYPYLTYHDEVLVSKKSRFAKKSYLTREDIRTEPFVVVNADLEKTVKREISPRYCTLAPDTAFRDRLVESNEAISIIPSINRLSSQASSVVQVPLADGWDVTLAFVGHSDILNNKAVRHMINVLNSFYVRQDASMDKYYAIHFVS